MRDFARLPEEDQVRFNEASGWQLRLATDPALEMSEEFIAWHADPSNRRAFVGVSMVWKAAEEFAMEPQLLDMRQAALRRARVASTRRWRSDSLLLRAIAAIFVVSLLGAASAYYYSTLPAIYVTGAGERRTEALADGSHLTLDSDTKVEVRYSRVSRNLRLDRGRARFDVAHDVTRPFSVAAGGETVVAVGTAFDVERVNDKVLVTLIRGRIVVKGSSVTDTDPTRKSHPSISLRAGQQLVASRDAPPAIMPMNLQMASAWENGQLVFNGDTLAEAVVRVNRYTDQPIQVDPAIASIRIIGSFSAGDVSTFVSAVTSYFPVQATTNANNTVLLQPRT